MKPADPFELRVAAVAMRIGRLALRALIVFVIVAGLIAGAGWSAHRVFGWHPPAAIADLFLEKVQSAEALLYVEDNATGWRGNPYTQLRHVLRGPFRSGEAQQAKLRTNSEGFFDREHYVATPYHRIAILGDSWVEAQQVDATQRFSNLVEDYVHAFSKGARAVEIMNFGLSNLGTAQEAGVARAYVARYQPDEVWVVFNPADDISDSSPLFTPPPLGPTFTYGGDGAIVDVRFGHPHPPAVAASMRLERYRGWTDLHVAQVLPFLYSREKHPAFEVAFAEMRACFRLLRAAIPKARTTIVYLPPEREIAADKWAEYVAASVKATGRALELDPVIAEERLAAMAKAEGADFVSLRPVMKDKGAAEMYQGHLSRMGHHWVADFLAHRLLESDCCAMPQPRN